MIGKVFGAAVLVGLVAYSGYILLADEPCERVERATIPIHYIGDWSSRAAKPWNEHASIKLKFWGLKTRLAAVKTIKHQFYYDRGLSCPWDNADLGNI